MVVRMRDVAAMLLALGLLLSCGARDGAGAGSPQAVVAELLDALEALDEQRVIACFDTATPGSAKAAGRIGRLVGILATARAFEDSLRARFGDRYVAEDVALDGSGFPVARWRAALADARLEARGDGARLRVQGRPPIDFVSRFGRWFVHAPPLFRDEAGAADEAWSQEAEKLFGFLAGHFEAATRILRAAKTEAEFRLEMEKLGRTDRTAIAPLYQALQRAMAERGI